MYYYGSVITRHYPVILGFKYFRIVIHIKCVPTCVGTLYIGMHTFELSVVNTKKSAYAVFSPAVNILL